MAPCPVPEPLAANMPGALAVTLSCQLLVNITGAGNAIKQHAGARQNCVEKARCAYRWEPGRRIWAREGTEYGDDLNWSNRT